MGKGFDVLPKLLHIGHAAEHHVHVGQVLDEAQGPRRGAQVRIQGAQRFLLRRVQAGQPSSAHRFHHPHRDAQRGQQLVFFLCLLKRPVQIVQLDLAEGHLLAIQVQKGAQVVHLPMAGKAQEADAPQPALLKQVIHDAQLRVAESGGCGFAHIVQQVEIEVAYPAFLQLLFEDGGGSAPGGGHVAGKLRGQQVALAGIIRQDAAHDALGLASMVGVGGVEVVQAMLHGIRHHVARPGLIYVAGAVRKQRQAHGAEAQQRQREIMKLAGHHRVFPP